MILSIQSATASEFQRRGPDDEKLPPPSHVHVLHTSTSQLITLIYQSRADSCYRGTVEVSH